MIGLAAVAGEIVIIEWWQQRQMKNEIENIVATTNNS